MSKNTGTSELINYFDLGVNGDVGIAGSLDINTIANATTDTDTFLVSDTGIIKYRTGAQLLSDIGAQGLLTNPVTGTGASGTIPVFTGSTTIGNSIIQSNATQVNIVGNGSQLLFDSLGSTKNGGIQYINDFTLQISNSRGTGSSINLGDINLDFNTNVSANPKLRITAGGNVLIGTTTDSGAKLEVAGGGVLSLLLSGNITDATRKFAFIEGKHYTNSEEPIAMIGIDSQVSSSILYIGGGLTSGLNAATSISFQTAANNTTVTGTERMCITSVGQVGIGTSNPVRQFVISNGGADGIEFTQLVGSQTTEIITYNRSTSLYTPLQFESSVYTFNRGNLLVGTTTDNGSRLQVSGDIFANSQIQASSPNSGNTQMLLIRNYATSATGNFTGNYTAEIRGASNGNLTHTMNIHLQENNLARRILDITSLVGTVASFCSNGNVGIGTASPDVTGFGWRTLTIRGGTTSGEAGVLELQSPTTTGAANLGIIAFMDGSNRNAQIGVQRDSSTTTANMLFYTNAGAGIVERMRITSGGQLLVGTSFTDSGISVDFQNLSSASSNVLVRAKNTTLNEDCGFIISANSSGTQRDYTIGIQTIVNSPDLTFSGPTGFQWYVGSSERMKITSGGDVYLNNAAALFFGPTSVTYLTGSTTNMIFAVNTGERMRITSGGNVGIGSTSPFARLQVTDSNTSEGTIAIGHNIYPGLIFSSANTGEFRIDNRSSAGGGYISFYPNGQASTLGNEAMRVSTSRNLLIGTTTDTGARLNVGGSYDGYPVSIEAGSGGNQLSLTRGGAVAQFYMGGSTAGGTQFYVRAGGSGGVLLSAGSTGWVSASDIRLKDVTKPIENAVESLSSLQTIYYSWKDSINKNLHIGLIAQEVEKVFPELVSESSIDGMKGVNYTELIPVIIKAIQELNEKINR